MRAKRVAVLLVLAYGSVIQSAAAETPGGNVQLVSERVFAPGVARSVQPITDSLARAAREQAHLMTVDSANGPRTSTCPRAKRAGIGALIGGAIGFGSTMAWLMYGTGSDGASMYMVRNTLLGTGAGIFVGALSCDAVSATSRP